MFLRPLADEVADATAIRRDADGVLDAVEEPRASLRRPPATMEHLLDRLAEQGLRASVAAIRAQLG